MEYRIKIFIIALSINILLCMIRAVIGPSKLDRLVAINIIGTKTIVLIASVAFIIHETFFIDVVLVYALISFLSSIFVCNPD
ncbi:monovalent cation/H+ antiporter complex subunit F [Abyssisolibacter fermentans]|uniref:monovalent cation/H+ antiporter complex subunit F n=1 Tax=Abyssisolibacter fermentans TaxID=1766203 RepID=UPI00082D5CC1|nr:monovalent cation/H+ antiporter complex subunit F [Abyssisolibacter fermentans]